ncbi:hypothetical protein GFL92_01110 [Rhizobium leguminosarum bv. viciae]|nr:hypothetical protein [Rhizobium leguminosarum bv. viciae]
MDDVFNLAKTAIGRGTTALSIFQSSDGSFPLYPCTKSPPSSQADPIFLTASVVLACGDVLPKTVLSNALDYIERREWLDHLWNWHGFPPDADDSAVALAALIKFGRCDGRTANVLRRFWRDQNGPFSTWPSSFLQGRESPDPVVNCNVLFCLQIGQCYQQREREAIENLIKSVVSRGTHHSDYYCCVSSLLYAAARAGLGVIDFGVMEASFIAPGTHVQYYAEALNSQRFIPPDAVSYVIRQQEINGGWPGAPWVSDKDGDYLSPAYATALAIQLLYRFVDQAPGMQLSQAISK